MSFVGWVLLLIVWSRRSLPSTPPFISLMLRMFSRNSNHFCVVNSTHIWWRICLRSMLHGTWSWMMTVGRSLVAAAELIIWFSMLKYIMMKFFFELVICSFRNTMRNFMDDLLFYMVVCSFMSQNIWNNVICNFISDSLSIYINSVIDDIILTLS